MTAMGIYSLKTGNLPGVLLAGFYGLFRGMDSVLDVSGHIADLLAPTTLDTVEYPKTVLYDYLKKGQQIPSDVRRDIQRGLDRRGEPWPTREDYPTWLKHRLSERKAPILHLEIGMSIELE